MLQLAPNDIRLLLDENISPRIVPDLWEAGIDAVALRDRNQLQIADHAVLSYAEADGRVVATINEVDFEKLLLKKKTHGGVVTIPSGGTRDEQLQYILAAATHLRQSPSAMQAVRDCIIAVNEELQVSRRWICAPSVVPNVAVAKKPAG